MNILIKNKIFTLIANWLICSIILVCLASCNNETSLQDSSDNTKTELIIEEGLTLRSDFEHDYENLSGYAVLNRGDSTFISHRSNDFVFTFDASSGNLISKQKIIREGPLSVGSSSMFDNSYFISRDSFLYSSNSENKIYLSSRKSTEVIVDYSDGDDFQLVNSYRCVPVEGASHILFLISRSTRDGNPQRYSFVAVNQDLSSHKEVISALPVYKGKFYGNISYLYWPSMVYNQKSGTYVVSFPIDHRIFEYDQNFNLLREHELFHESIGAIEPLAKEWPAEGDSDWQKEDVYYNNLSHFVDLHYLRGSDQYVRIARFTHPGDGKWKFLGFVYDGEFNLVEKFEISEDQSIFNAFALENGMYFLNKSRVKSERMADIPFDRMVFKNE